MKGLYIIAATAIGFATGCADKAQVTPPTPATTNAAIPARPAEKTIAVPNPSAAPATAITISPGQAIIDRDPPERIPVSR
jgi:hypothetical protein